METTATASWQLNGTTATYGTDDETLITIEGVTSTDGLGKPSGTTVKISAASLDPDSIVTISDGYTLELGNDVGKAELSVEWDFRGNTVIGEISVASDGYQVKNNQIQYFTKDESYSSVSVTVTGTTIDEAGLSVNGNVVTVSRAALSGVEMITVSNGFKLALGSDVTPIIVTDPSWTYLDNTLTYMSGGSTEGYVLTNNVIRHVSTKNSERVTISGISTSTDGTTASGVERVGTTFIISESCLIKDEENIVKISGEDYYLALADGIPEPIETEEGWSLDGTTATYKTASNTEGFTLEGNKITYTPETEPETVVTVYGVKSTEGLDFDENDDSIIVVYEESLGEDEITISNGYKLKLDNDAPHQGSTAGWKLADKRATYEVGGMTEGYKLENNKIVYSAETPGEEKIALNGVESKPSFVDDYEGDDEEDGKAGIVQLALENFSEEGISLESNARGYSFKIVEGAYQDGRFVGGEDKDTVANDGSNLNIELGGERDSIVNNGSNVFIDGGAGNDFINNEGGVGISVKGGAGNDNVTLSADSIKGGENIFVYSTGEGKDKVSSFGKSDKIQLDNNAAFSAEVKNNNVVFKIGSGTITIQEGATSNREITIIDSDSNTISNNTYTHDGIISDTENSERKIVLASTFEGEYEASESIKDTGKVTIVDATQVTKSVTLNGGEEGISLIGGNGKDTLINGETDGFELTGGKGNDVFVYNGGKGSITDYSQKGTGGKDKLDAGLDFESFEVNGDNVILNYGEGDELTIEDGADKEITFGTKSTTIRTFKEVGIFDVKGKEVTLASGEVDFSATRNYAKVEMIDGSNTRDNKITGNKKANLIIAGKGSTLDGGKGKDTLVGGDGNDVFIYDAKTSVGNKLIQNYGEGDKISLTNGASISEVKSKGGDLELKVGNNKITIEGGAGSSFTFDDGKEKTFTTSGLIVKETSASLTSAFSGNEFKMADYDYTSVNAGLLKKSFKLIGDSDTYSLIGGKGNDVLIGSEGTEDTFKFCAGEGTDTIYGFNSGGTLDELILRDKRDHTDAKFKGVFSGNSDNGTLILSINGGGKVLVEGISASETIKINGDFHTINGKKLN